MLLLTDPIWRQLDGGYRTPYDASIALAQMERGESVWGELWEELHHQGGVGVASYAAIPQVVRICEARRTSDWNLYALSATIEIQRHRKNNPPLPAWLSLSYKSAWDDLVKLALADLAGKSDELILQSALSVVALGRGDIKLGAMINHADTDEIDAYVEENLAWSSLYA
ncbi:MAG TPA: hypothetical protein VK794_10550 [Steroidobacteraceae bacterium]|jgi:hypothetical protein|nr:hypothetical protein [Steroidobacteraceae bacterium]